MSDIKAPKKATKKVADIKPYWGNPRLIPEEAVNAVQESIERYGYQQPIIVDKDNVIVVGHTRHAALQKMGIKQVEVYVSDLTEEKAREYRLIDNRTAEMTFWDHDALMLELREFEETLLSSFFPDVSFEVDQLEEVADVTEQDIVKATEKTLNTHKKEPHLTTEVVCPSCFHSFEVRTDTLPGLSRGDLSALKASRGAEE